MTADTRQDLQNIENLDIRIDYCLIMNVKSRNRLGIITDEKLNWTSHVDYLCTAVSSQILLLTQLAFYVNLHRAIIGPSATLTGR